jgi:hypothetical protein
MKRLFKGNCLAVVISSDFGTQWYTNHKVPELLFDPNIISIIQDETLDKIQRGIKIEDYCDETYGERVYWGDSTSLQVEWVGLNGKFGVVYEDGWETIIPGPEFEVFKA